MKDERFDLEGELRSGRSRPRDEFATALAGEVRGASTRARQSRFGTRLAVAGLAIVAVMSFGGISYAAGHNAADDQYGDDSCTICTTSTTTTETTTTPETTTTEPATTQQTTTVKSAVVPQTFTPPAAKPKAKVTPKVHKAKKNAVHRVQTAGAVKASNVSPKVVKSGQLPFTGLALWIPLAFGLVLIAFGVTLRTKARRRGPAAH